mmetsp:Transcript_5170/g.11985  ORF Transcript_5170/g.11985 Transcript_5170/m.11985 type:complete len:235 (+) Transcript_5170:260-964(+)
MLGRVLSFTNSIPNISHVQRSFRSPLCVSHTCTPGPRLLLRIRLGCDASTTEESQFDVCDLFESKSEFVNLWLVRDVQRRIPTLAGRLSSLPNVGAYPCACRQRLTRVLLRRNTGTMFLHLRHIYSYRHRHRCGHPPPLGILVLPRRSDPFLPRHRHTHHAGAVHRFGRPRLRLHPRLRPHPRLRDAYRLPPRLCFLRRCTKRDCCHHKDCILPWFRNIDRGARPTRPHRHPHR